MRQMLSTCFSGASPCVVGLCNVVIIFCLFTKPNDFTETEVRIMKKTKKKRVWVGTQEAATRLQIHQNTVIAWCKHYDGFAFKVGERWRVYVSAIDAILEGKELPKKRR